MRSRIDESKPDIIVVVETWLNDEILDSEINISGYSVLRSKSINELRSGIVFYIRINSSNSIELCNCLNDFDFLESFWIWVTNSQHRKVLIGAVYRKGRHLDDSFNDENNNMKLLDLIKKAKSLSRNNLLIVGDFNLKNIDWVNHFVHPPDNFSTQFLDLINDLSLNQHITDITRFRGSDTPSTLDLLISSNCNDICDYSISPPLGLGDHCCITFEYTLDIIHNTQAPVNRPNYKLADWDGLKNFFNETDWSLVNTSNSIDEAFQNFLNIYNQGVETFIPTTSAVYDQSRPPWFNNNVKSAIRQKYFSFKRYMAHRTNFNRLNYIQKRNCANHKVKEAKRLYEYNIVSDLKSNPKRFFNYIRNNKNSKVIISKLLKHDGSYTTNDSDSAKVLNDHFKSVFNHEHTFDDNMEENYPHNHSKLENFYFTPNDVYQLLISLDVSKGTGPDNTHNIVIKNCAQSLCFPLYCIFRLSLDSGCLPDLWKCSNIIPIYKKGSHYMAENYRPISLTSVICKIMERLLRKPLLDHLYGYNLINSNQHGFVKNRSCFSNLLDALEDWTKWYDSGFEFDVIFLDFKRAFDLVPHNRLLYKCKKLGIDGLFLSWIKSFLKDRKQRVTLNGTFTEWVDVISGVPQGSVLGPILFLIFINDICDNIESEINLFADDTKIYNFDSDALQKDLKSLLDWAHKWGMEFNNDKCKVMHFGSYNPLRSYTFDTYTLSVTNEEKDLGVLQDNSLLFRKHMASIAMKFYASLNIFKRTFTHINCETFSAVYNFYLRPYLDYCSQIWSPYMSGDIDFIEKLQRKATKSVLGLSNLDYNERLYRLKLSSLVERRHKLDMVELYKIINGYVNVDASKYFTLRNNPRLRGHNFHLKTNRFNTLVRKNFFTQRVVQKWNTLPSNIVNSNSIGSFKYNYDQYIRNTS